MADAKVVFETELDTTGLKQGLKELDSSGLNELTIGASESTLTELGTKLGKIIGTSTVLAIAKSIGQTSMAFDTAMSQVAATMGTTVADIKPLQELAELSGKTTKFSAVEAAEALNYMALAGWDVEEIFSGFPEMLNLAAAGSLDLAYASDVVTDGLTAMGLTANDAGQLVDEMAKTASTSNTSVKQLGQGILAVGATARTLAGGTTELNTVLGLLADNGIKATKGGRQLRNIITALGSPIEKAQVALDDLGVSAYDIDGNFRPLADTFNDLRVSLEGMTDQERLFYIDEIFNKEDFASVNALLGTTAERWGELTSLISSSDGYAGQMAATLMDNLGGDVEEFNSAVEGLKLNLYRPFGDLARGYTQMGTGAINSLSNVFAQGLEAGADAAAAKVETTWSDLWGMITDEATFVKENQQTTTWGDFFSSLLPGAGAEGLSVAAADTAGVVQQQLNSELRKAFADGDPQVQAALMAGLTPADGSEGGQTATQQLAESIGNELVAGLEAQQQKTAAAMKSLVDTAISSLGEIQTAGDLLAANEWTPSVKVNDQASAAIESIRASLASLDGASATVHINASGEIPGHADGLSYVPYDNYLAYLHKGEMVLTAKEAEALRSLSDRDFASSLASRTYQGGMGASAGMAGDTIVHQTINFNQPVQTPDELAQTMKMYATYGLAGGE